MCLHVYMSCRINIVNACVYLLLVCMGFFFLSRSFDWSLPLASHSMRQRCVCSIIGMVFYSHICIYMYIYIYIHISIYMFFYKANMYTYIFTYFYTCIYMYAFIFMYTVTRGAEIFMYTHTYSTLVRPVTQLMPP